MLLPSILSLELLELLSFLLSLELFCDSNEAINAGAAGQSVTQYAHKGCTGEAPVCAGGITCEVCDSNGQCPTSGLSCPTCSGGNAPAGIICQSMRCLKFN